MPKPKLKPIAEAPLDTPILAWDKESKQWVCIVRNYYEGSKRYRCWVADSYGYNEDGYKEDGEVPEEWIAGWIDLPEAPEEN